MRRRLFLANLAALLLLVGACGDESTNPVQTLPLNLAGGEIGLPIPTWGPTPDVVLAGLEYEEFHGTIIPGEGGFLLGEMSTWPSGCYFSIQVPPEALTNDPGEGGSADPVPFSMRVPTYQSYMDHQDLNGGLGLPLTIDLEPSNLVFEVPVIVSATYMPWSGPRLDWIWDVWTLDPSYQNEFEYSAQSMNRKIMITFEVPHFSRWQGGGGPPSPIVR